VLRCDTTSCLGPPTVLASGQNGAALVATDGTAAYWTLPAGPNVQLLRCDFSNCSPSPTPLTQYGNTMGASAIAVAGGEVYWGDHDNVVRCPITGCPGPQNLATAGTPLNAISLVYPTGYFSGDHSIKARDLSPRTPTVYACHGG